MEMEAVTVWQWKWKHSQLDDRDGSSHSLTIEIKAVTAWQWRWKRSHALRLLTSIGGSQITCSVFRADTVDMLKTKMTCMSISTFADSSCLLSWTQERLRKWPRRQTGGQSDHFRWPAPRKMWNTDEFETQTGASKPRTSHHRSTGLESHRQREKAAADVEWKAENGPLFPTQTLELFQRQPWGKPLRDGARYHLEQNWTKLN